MLMEVNMKNRTNYSLWVMVVTIACVALCSFFLVPAQAGHPSLEPATLGHSTADDDTNDSDGAASFVYTLTNPADPNADPTDPNAVGGPNAVDAFTRNRETGRLTYMGRYLTGGLGDPFVGGSSQHSLVSNGKHLYAVNPGDDTISALEIRRDSSLRLLNRVPSGGRRPASLALHGNLLYVANQGNSPEQPPDLASYSGFRVRRDGSLQPLPGSTITLNVGDTAADILFNRNGDVLIGDRLIGNTIDSFRVNRDGYLTDHKTFPGGGGPFGAIFSPVRPQHLIVTAAVPEAFPNELAPGVAS
jgi:hypothetical protein